MKQFFLALFSLLTIASNAQLFMGAGTGASTRGKLAAELQVGYNFKFLLLQTGFVTHTNNTNPAFFQVKTGHEFRFGEQALVLTGGYAYQLLNTTYKENNKNTYTSGIEYLKYIRDGGAIYTGVTRTGDFTFLTVGLKYFFTRGNQYSTQD